LPCQIEKRGYTVDRQGKKITWNLRNNNLYASYTLLRLTFPWVQNNQDNQALLSVTFGGYLLWSGNDPSAGATFGPDAFSEFIWPVLYPERRFEMPVAPATNVNEDLVFVFYDRVEYMNQLTIAVFVNDVTGDTCDVSEVFQR
jgi:hypothetical protein